MEHVNDASFLRTCGISLTAILVVHWTRSWVSRRTRARELSKLGAAKLSQRNLMRKEQRAAQPPAVELSDHVRDKILHMSATELLDAISSGALSSVDVTTSYVDRAREAGEELNTNCEERFAEALADAALCDKERAEGNLRGRLHGLPISVKDQFHQKGCDSTMGMQVRCFHPADEDGLLVGALRAEGAIPFCRTNTPQCLMVPESQNNVWGRSSNPYDLTRGVGGSSGGEAGLIAANGSPLGLGTDIGGSIRIPAQFCGIVGFKPTTKRISSMGIAVPRKNDESGQHAVVGAAGPMGTTVQDMQLIMEIWCGSKVWAADPEVAPIPWERCDFSVAPSGGAERKMTFGYFTNDKFFDTAPACARAVEEAVVALKKDGHTVVPFDFDFFDACVNYVALMSADGSLRCFKEGLEGEDLHEMYSFMNWMACTPAFIRSPLVKLMQLVGKRRLAALVGCAAKKDAYQLWDQVIVQKVKIPHASGWVRV
eukprot:TRINITY_DN13169_c0_g1_i1.p1 TRINITY_DN13169_c0_g1~~TRINITY_DN13169_c0_g1_i1.p1  ORF type:complete len:484 (+),score=102.74 TRINITY_DN13169_c0_g1_i1:174-1625(+)